MWLLFLVFLLIAPVSAEPKVLGEAPLWLVQNQTELRLGLNFAELQQRLGKWPNEGQDWATFLSGVTVFLHEDRVAQLSVSQGDWSLRQEGQQLLTLGQPQSRIEEVLGKPRLVMSKPGLDVWLYTSPQADLGVMVSAGTSRGILLLGPRKLETVLFMAGYRRP